MPEIGYLGAAMAGLLSFFSPCILPIVPFYLAYLGGLSMTELRDETRFAGHRRRRLVLAAITFALGLSSIFMLLGLGATALGRAVADYHQVLTYLSALILMAFGLHFLGFLRFPLFDRSARITTNLRPGSIPGAYLMGLAFGFGWTPCAGPALAAILLIASGSGEWSYGVSLLFIFALGMTLPFVLIASLAPKLFTWRVYFRPLSRHVERATGILLILFALLIATDSIQNIADWMLQNFDWSATII